MQFLCVAWYPDYFPLKCSFQALQSDSEEVKLIGTMEQIEAAKSRIQQFMGM